MKLGIALAGGGVRGSAHLGIITALDEQGIVADMYAGSSAGAIVASFKSLGLTNEECLEAMHKMGDGLFDIAYWDIIKNIPNGFHKLNGFLKGKKLRSILKERTQDAKLSNVQKPLSIITCDITTGAQVVFSSQKLENYKHIDDHIKAIEGNNSMPLFELMYASAAIPGIYPPISYEDMTLIDGSITNSLPVNVLKQMGATHIIAIDLVNRKASKEVAGVWDTLGRSINIMIEQNIDLSMKGIENCVQLNPSIEGTGFLEFDKLMETYEQGYNYGKVIAPTVQKILKGLE